MSLLDICIYHTTASRCGMTCDATTSTCTSWARPARRESGADTLRSFDPCGGRRREALVLLLTWSGAGLYEVVTYGDDVMVLSTTHACVEHLKVLHTEYVDRLSSEELRRTSDRKWAPVNDVAVIE